MIVIAEPTCIGSEHAPFNAAIVEVAAIMASGSHIIFYGDQSHIEAVKQVLGDRTPDNITWFPIITPKRSLRDFAKRFCIEFKLFGEILISSKKSNLLIVTSAVETSLPALKAQCLLLRFKPRINVIFHAGLPQFLYSKKRHRLLCWATPANMAYIVLGDYIKNAVLRIIPKLSNNIFGIEHPYLFNTAITKLQGTNNPSLFGFVGLATLAKGFDVYLNLIECLSNEYSSDSFQPFKLVGKVGDDCVDIFDEFKRGSGARLLNYPAERANLPLNVYRSEISSLDYFVMPYDKHSYEFICSGAAMDALYFKKPIIALKSPYFSYLFDLCGDIGYLCDDLNEMVSTVKRLFEFNDLSRYERQISNLASAQAKFSPIAVARQLEEIDLIKQLK